MIPESNCALKLPTAPETAVFRAIVAKLLRDPTLNRVIAPAAWHLFNGRVSSALPPSRTGGPELWIFPSAGPSRLKFEASQVLPLFLNVDMTIPTSNSDDVLNLWHAIRTALFTGDFASDATFRASLQTIGAHTGLITFSQAAFDPDPEVDGRFLGGRGQLMIEVRLNT